MLHLLRSSADERVRVQGTLAVIILQRAECFDSQALDTAADRVGTRNVFRSQHNAVVFAGQLGTHLHISMRKIVMRSHFLREIGSAMGSNREYKPSCSAGRASASALDAPIYSFIS